MSYIYIHILQLEGGSILTSWKKQNSRFPINFSNFLIDAFVTCYKRKEKKTTTVRAWNGTKTATNTNREKQEKNSQKFP